MFCTQPFNHIDVIVENEFIEIQPCNVWSGERCVSSHAYNDWINPIRKTLYANFSYGCEICKINESQNTESRRVSSNSFSLDNNLPTDSIVSVGLRYGTLCNAKCMVCDHTRSTGWISDSISLGKKINSRYKFQKNKMENIEKVFEKFNLTNLRYVEFHGGEPLLHHYPESFLKLYANKNLTVKFNTNGSLIPNKKLSKLIDNCKEVIMLLSIDDVDKRFELLRFPLKWNTVLQNIKYFKQSNYTLGITPTISALNVWYLEELLEWIIKNNIVKVYPQFVYNPNFLDIKNLHQEIKEKLKEKFIIKNKLFSSIHNRLNQKGLDLTKQMITYIESLDKIRNTNYFNVLRSWHEVIQNSLYR